MNTPNPSPKPRGASWPLAIVLCVAIVAGVAAFAIHQIAGVAGTPLNTVDAAVTKILSWPEQIAAATTELLRAKTTIVGSSVSLPLENIAELGLVKRRVVVHTKQENSVLGVSTTRVIRGVFELKAGYDLRRVHITFDEKNKAVTIALPKPEILSLTTIEQKTWLGPTIWDPTSQQDDEGNEANRKQAHAEAMDQGLAQEVEDRMKERVRDLFFPFAKEDKIIFVESTDLAPVPTGKQ